MLERHYHRAYERAPKPTVSYQHTFRKIALVLTRPMGIGDLIMATPAISSFRAAFPKAITHLVTDKPVFDRLPPVDAIKLVKGSLLGMKASFKSLSKEQYDLVVVLNRGVNQTWYAQALHAPYQMGHLGGYIVQANFSLKKENLSFDPLHEHYSLMSLNIVRSLGYKTVLGLPKPVFSLETKTKVKEHMHGLAHIKKPIIMVAPFALWKTRAWSEESYVELISRLYKQHTFILIGGADAMACCSRITKHLSNQDITVQDWSGHLNVPQTMCAMTFADLLVTSDGGPMHFGYMMQVPTLALFGPVPPEHRVPLDKRQRSKICTLWAADYDASLKSSLYRYEQRHDDPRLSGLPAVPVKVVESRIRFFFRRGGW